MKLKLENRQIAVYTALILAVIMLFLPGSSKNKYRFEPEVMAKTINEKGDQVSPQDLSQWIIEGKTDYQLIDIRNSEEYAKGNIKTSENIPLENLLKRSTIDTDLSDSKMIILYSNGNSHAHQAWLVLKAAGKDAYVLEGGFNHWVAAILNPEPAKDSSDDEILKYNLAASISSYFGGGNAVKSTDNPVKSTDSKGSGAVKPKSKKKKLEGC
ncbi:MAG: hypothetical protein CVV44_13755 [Spirochaetae bacterium HGW-Spirochaetae-1]|jgi:rhodanese-related sulfurtransferase|nr:MAG: hypothetical protein CVV44_13755 [Spirochaetae bacterium HGW-Spirochaetae-1]